MYKAKHWLYLNIAEQNANSFVPAWAAYRGILAAPNILLTPEQRRTHLGLTPHLTRLLRKADALSLEKELRIERIRREHFPSAVSRLNCIYCWQDEKTARLAPKYWANQGKHFEDRYLVEIGVSANKAPTLVDTRWIDRYVNNSNEPLKDIGTDWIHQYWRGAVYPWNGESDLPEEPLIECLVDGTALIWGTALRMEAFSLVESLAPDSVGILEKGRLGVDLCTRFDGEHEWRLGQIVPVLMSDRKRKALQVNHLILLDEALAGSVNHKVPLVGIKSNEINHRALEVFKKDNLKLPDLRPINVNADWLPAHPVLNGQIVEMLTATFIENGGDIQAAIKHQQDNAMQQA